MSVEITVPQLPESVADAQLLQWKKEVGQTAARDEVLVEIETDKVALEITAPAAGRITEILQSGEATVTAGQVLAKFAADADGPAADAPDAPQNQQPPARQDAPPDEARAVPQTATPAENFTEQPADEFPRAPQTESANATAAPTPAPLGPAARRLIAAHGLQLEKITGRGPGGRITKEDVLNFIEAQVAPDDASAAAAAAPAADQVAAAPATQPDSEPPSTLRSTSPAAARAATREPLSRVRRAIAARLVQSQQTAALLTTFNEVNMQPVTELRANYKDEFEKTHGARLGLMSFFVKASVSALQKFPLVNARIDGDDLVRHNYQDIGIAVASKRGLVVPILRDCARLSFKDIEIQIRDFAARADAGKISLEELSGGTFTITNGGVFGSLLSTPIVNPPQSAILGMHKIQPRPVAEDGEVAVRPMMYLALSYDHRLIDGADAVGFLVAVKQALEQPAQLLLQL